METLENFETEQEQPEQEQVDIELIDKLSQYRFRNEEFPPKEDPVILHNGHVLGTAGNIATGSGKEKSGKTTGLLQSILGAAIGGEGEDVLNFDIHNPDRLMVTYFDFEMSYFHFWRMVKGAMRRAGVSELPSHVSAFHLLGLSRAERLKALEAVVKHAPHRLVLIDGWGDMVADTNDIKEANRFVEQVHNLADSHGCFIKGILHENPGGMAGSKTRGHLGSELQRKGEFVMTCERNEDLIQLWTPQCRNRPILQKEAIGIRFDEDRGMFVLSENVAQVRANEKREAYIATILELAAGDTSKSWRHTDLCNGIMSVEGVKIDAAKNRVKAMRGAEVVYQHGATGLYLMVDEVKNRINGR